MSHIDLLAKDFLAQKCIAVAGVSATKKDAANAIYTKLLSAGYEVFAVNPNARTIEGKPCYPDLKSLPKRPDGVVVVTRPAFAEQIVRDCAELGIPRVWMHCMLGTRPRFGKSLASKMTSVSDDAIRLCKANKITVIPGGCPMMFCDPVDGAHKCMRGLLRLIGAFEEPVSVKVSAQVN